MKKLLLTLPIVFLLIGCGGGQAGGSEDENQSAVYSQSGIYIVNAGETAILKIGDTAEPLIEDSEVSMITNPDDGTTTLKVLYGQVEVTIN